MGTYRIILALHHSFVQISPGLALGLPSGSLGAETYHMYRHACTLSCRQTSSRLTQNALLPGLAQCHSPFLSSRSVLLPQRANMLHATDA